MLITDSGDHHHYQLKMSATSSAGRNFQYINHHSNSPASLPPTNNLNQINMFGNFGGAANIYNNGILNKKMTFENGSAKNIPKRTDNKVIKAQVERF